MVRRLLVLLPSLACFVLSPVASAAVSFEQIARTGPELSQGRPVAVSDNGRTVLLRFASSSMLWTTESGLLPLPNGAPLTMLGIPTALSPDGRLLGGLTGTNAYGLTALAPAWIWDHTAAPPSVIHRLDGLDSGNYVNDVKGLTNNGIAALTMLADQTPANARAARWNPSTGLEPLSPLPGHNCAVSAGISADGSIVVGTTVQWPLSIFGPVVADGTAVRWLADGSVEPIAPPASRAVDVSADGSVILGLLGVQFNITGLPSQRPFLWTTDNGMVELDPIPNASYTDVVALSGDGRTILAGNYLTAPWLWRQDTGWTRMTDILAASGIDLSGWQSLVPDAISYNGSTIVGTGLNPQNQWASWIATIPEPAAGSILLTTLLFLSVRRR